MSKSRLSSPTQIARVSALPGSMGYGRQLPDLNALFRRQILALSRANGKCFIPEIHISCGERRVSGAEKPLGASLSSDIRFRQTFTASFRSHAGNTLSARNVSSFCHRRMKTSCVMSLASASSSARRRARAYTQRECSRYSCSKAAGSPRRARSTVISIRYIDTRCGRKGLNRRRSKRFNQCRSSLPPAEPRRVVFAEAKPQGAGVEPCSASQV